MKRIYISLFGGKKNIGIENAIRQLEEYKQTLNDKTKDFVIALSDIGINVVNARLGSISPFYKGNTASEKGTIIHDGDSWTCEIVMSGDQALFIEFGAGVTFNAPVGDSKHPKGKELGMTIGSYNPESPNAASPNGWWYYDKYGQKQHTYGTPTFAPMYNGSLEMINAISDVAHKVFKNG